MRNLFTKKMLAGCAALGVAVASQAQTIEDFEGNSPSIFTPVGDNSFVSDLGGNGSYALRFPSSVPAPTGQSYFGGGGGGGGGGSGGGFVNLPPPDEAPVDGPELHYIYTNSLNPTADSYLSFRFKIEGAEEGNGFSFYVLGIAGELIEFDESSYGVFDSGDGYSTLQLTDLVLSQGIDYSFAIGIGLNDSQSAYSMVVDDIVLNEINLNKFDETLLEDEQQGNPYSEVPDAGSLGIFGLLAAVGAFIARRRKLF